MTIKAECRMSGLRLIHARESVLAAWDAFDKAHRLESAKFGPSLNLLKEAQENYQHPDAKLNKDELSKLDKLLDEALFQVKQGNRPEALPRLAALRDKTTDLIFEKVVTCALE